MFDNQGKGNKDILGLIDPIGAEGLDPKEAEKQTESLKKTLQAHEDIVPKIDEVCKKWEEVISIHENLNEDLFSEMTDEQAAENLAKFEQQLYLKDHSQRIIDNLKMEVQYARKRKITYMNSIKLLKEGIEKLEQEFSPKDTDPNQYFN